MCLDFKGPLRRIGGRKVKSKKAKKRIQEAVDKERWRIEERRWTKKTENIEHRSQEAAEKIGRCGRKKMNP